MTAPAIQSSTFTVEVPDGPERGIRIACDEHGEDEEFRPAYRTVAFYCEQCGYEIELSVRDLHDWRDLGERC